MDLLIRLTALDPAFASGELTLAEGGSAVIGRAPFVDFRVVDPSVGRNVVRLSVAGGALHVEDLASGGGSAVEIDGERIDRYSGVLPDGAVLWVGAVGFRVGGWLADLVLVSGDDLNKINLTEAV